MDRAREALTRASHKLAKEMYKAIQAQAPSGGGAAAGSAGTGQAGGAPSGGNGKSKDEGVIDAEYVHVEDKK